MQQERTRVRVVSAELEVDGRYLITQRRPDATLPLLWEFPGGRVREGETDEAALKRCLVERVGVEVEVHEALMEVVHDYGSYVLTLAVLRCELPFEQEATARHVHDIAWVRPDGFAAYAFPGADQQTVDLLIGSLD